MTSSNATESIGTSSVPKRVVAKLIHRNSIRSPLYDPSHTDIDCAKFALENSIARFAMIEQKMKSCKVNVPCSDNIQANLRAKKFVAVFFVEFYIKDTSHPVLAVMDTGSTLLWVHCIPCENCAQASVPIYNPSTSSTYTNVSCLSEYCDTLHHPTCDERKNCKYVVEYVGAPRTEGILARESLIFDTSDEGLLTIPNVIFGCSHESREKPDSVMGVFGLNSNKLSVATQLGNKFSYCVGKVKDPSYEYNQLILGEGAILEGDSTPLDLYKGFYFVTLEGISLGGALLDIPRAVFERTASGNGGVMIDSGGESSVLTQRAYEELADAVREMSELKSWFKRDEDFNALCFEGDVNKDTKGFPVVTFHFSGGAELGLEADSLFSQSSLTYFCMTVMESPSDYSVIGMNAQQFYNMEYDISGKKMYLRRMDCELLDE
ncbi:aspartic proteinase CDR1-like [Rhodamnia argentea]|uniref:Aspartic proteinase CDR1-like n=1 Tax=Rhodamnia argentea TaxID=178133 RepID=A0A8B8QHN0_9MYRT|nr:aspartic proteinase CDR1-like [Rhodamnia argentea]